MQSIPQDTHGGLNPDQPTDLERLDSSMASMVDPLLAAKDDDASPTKEGEGDLRR